MAGIGTLLVALRRSTPAGDAVVERALTRTSLFVGLAFLAGFLGLFGAPPLPSASRVLAATDWMAWLAFAAGPVLAFDERLGRGAIAVRLLVLAGMVVLLTRALVEYTWSGTETALWWLGLVALGGGLAASAGAMTRRMATPSLSAAWLVVATGLALCSGLTGSARVAQTVQLLCAGLGAVLVAALVARRRDADVRLLPGDGAYVALVLFGFGLCAHFYSELDGTGALLLAAGLLLPWIAEGIVPAGRPRPRAVLRVVLALVPVAIAVGRAVAAFELEPAGEYGDYDYEY